MTQYDPNGHRADDKEILTPGEARQAPQGRPVLYVLVAGLVLALVAWAAVELYPRGTSQTALNPPGRPSAETTGTVTPNPPAASPRTGDTMAPPAGQTPTTSDSTR